MSPDSDRNEERPVYWGDKLALQVWLTCTLLLWLLAVVNLLTGLWGR